MAIKLTGNYAKRLGLPGYSSHQFSVSVETELSDLDRAPQEIAHLYGLLQEAVDREIQETGFVPGHDYGQSPSFPPSLPSPSDNGAWACSPKQAELIRQLARESQLEDEELHQMAFNRYGKPAAQLNKHQASGLIDELLIHRNLTERNSHRTGNGSNNGNANGSRSSFPNGSNRKGAHS